MDTFLETVYKKERLSYGITKKNNNEINLFRGYFPRYIIKQRNMDIDKVLLLEKRGFEIELEKIKD